MRIFMQNTRRLLPLHFFFVTTEQSFMFMDSPTCLENIDLFVEGQIEKGIIFLFWYRSEN